VVGYERFGGPCCLHLQGSTPRYGAITQKTTDSYHYHSENLKSLFIILNLHIYLDEDSFRGGGGEGWEKGGTYTVKCKLLMKRERYCYRVIASVPMRVSWSQNCG